MDNDAFAEGADARIAGQSEDANPYDPAEDEEDHLNWNDGWNSIDQEAE